MSAKAFQTTTGVENFDQRALGTNENEADSFYYDAARHMLARERGQGPHIVFVYLAQNHWPWALLLAAEPHPTMAESG